MCLLALYYRVNDRAPLLLAANREEYFDRPFTPPAVQPGRPQVFCGLDARAHGTWLGVNQHGLLVAVTNRPGAVPAQAPSRGMLCRELLNCEDAAAAIDRAGATLSATRHAPVNVLCADRQHAAVVSCDDHPAVASLAPGLHLLANGDLNDPQDMRQAYARSLLAPRFPRTPADFVAAARFVLSQGLDAAGERTIVVRHVQRGTVCSSIVVLANAPADSQFLFANGPPDRQPYVDLSAGLRQVLAAR